MDKPSLETKSGFDREGTGIRDSRGRWQPLTVLDKTFLDNRDELYLTDRLLRHFLRARATTTFERAGFKNRYKLSR